MSDVAAGVHRSLELNSWHFLVLAATAVPLLRLLRAARWRRVALLALNLYFLQHFVREAYPLAVIFGLFAFTWLAGEVRARWDDRVPKWIVVLIVLSLWGSLFILKEPKLNAWITALGTQPVAIVGLSYMCFRCIQYVMDADALERRDPLTLLNFILFFPTLLAGPIERYEDFEQFQNGQDQALDASPLPALHRIVNGVFKKFVLADNLAAFGIFAKSSDETWAWPMLVAGILLQPVLLYLDFSGYCDMMIGLARLMGFRLTENFDQPWKARNIQEFWNRWHITLSHFMRDYVFNPLNHWVATHARANWQFPLLLGVSFSTMLLIALWHGATWGFLAFGILHGTALATVQFSKRCVYPRLRPSVRGFVQESWIARGIAQAGTYLFICLTMSIWYWGVEESMSLISQLCGA